MKKHLFCISVLVLKKLIALMALPLLCMAFVCQSAFAGLPFAFWTSPATNSGPPQFSPVPGYFAWWNCDSNTTSGAGASVVAWQDLAGGLVLTPEVAGPTNNFNQNGHSTFTYSDGGPGTGNCLTNWTVSPFSTAGASGGYEITMVVRTGSDIGNGNPFCLIADNATARGIFLSDSQWELSWNGTTFGGSPTSSTLYVITALFQASGNSTLWVNGSVVLTQTGESGSETGISLGGFGTEYPWSGQIGDVIIYTTPPTDANRQTNEAGLRTKFGF
jgi:hypothetical protein